MKCSVCQTEIKLTYCPKCGQAYKPRKISATSLFSDLLSNVFSLEKSFVENVKQGLTDPRKLVVNYWDGFQKYYYTPGRFLVIAALFFLVQMTFFDDFLGGTTEVDFLPQQFVILFLIILLSSLIGRITYWGFDRNFFEHLIANVYNTSIWSIIIVPVSMILELLNASFNVKSGFVVVFLLLIFIWNARVFEMSNWKRLLYVCLNAALFGLVIWLLTQL